MVFLEDAWIRTCWNCGSGRVLKFVAFGSGWKRLPLERGGLKAMLFEWELLR